MGDTVRRDIILKIRADSDLTQIDRTISRLDDLDRRVQQLNSRLRIKVQAGTTGVATELAKVRKETEEISRSDAARNLSKGMQEFERQTGRAVEGMRAFKREIKTTAEGDVRSTIFSRGPLGSGLSFKKTQETGANTFTVDEARASKERDAFIKSRQQVRIAAERELEKIREGIRKHDEQVGRIQDRANTEYIVREKKAISQEAALRDKANVENIVRDKKAAADAAKVRENAEIENVVRTKKAINNERQLIANAIREGQIRDRSGSSFNQLASLPGVREIAGPQRITKTGGLVQDRVLVDQFGNQIARLNAETGKATTTMGRFGKETEQTGDTLQSAAAKVLLWTAATGAIFGAVRAIRAGADAFAQAESGTIRLERVGRGFSDALADTEQHQTQVAAGAQFVTQEILRQAVALGQTTAEAQEAAVVFARLGLSQRETADATRVAMLAANVAGIGAAEAAQLLASAMSQFHLNASDLPDLLDKLNTLENTTRVRTEDLLQSISRGGAVFREAGGSLEEMAAITAVVAEATSRSGAEIGNAFKTIASRLADPNLQTKIFEETGINVRTLTGELIPIGDLMGQLVVRFQQMTKAEQAELTTQIAGIRQRNILQTSLDNFFKSQGQVIRQLTTAGSAEKENERILTQLDVKLKQLAASFERLAVVVGDSGLGAALKIVVDFLRLTVDAIASMGRAGALVIGIIGLYTAAIVLASIATTNLAGNNGILAGSFAAIVRGSEVVNGFLLRTTTLMTGQAQAANAAAAANARLAASNAALSGGGAGRAGGIAAGASTLGSGLLSILRGPAAVAAGAAIGLAIVKVVRDGIRGNTTGSAFGEGSGEQGLRDRAAQASTNASNSVKAAQTRITTLGTIKELLSDIENEEAKGAQISAETSRVRAQAMDFLRGSVQLTADELAKLNANELTSADVSGIAARSEEELAKARDLERGSLELQLSTIEQQIKRRQQAITNNINVDRRSSGLNPFDRFLNADTGTFERIGAANDRFRGEIRDLGKEAENTKQKINQLDTEALDRAREKVEKARQSAKEMADEFIKVNSVIRETRDIREGVFASDDVDRLEIKAKNLARSLLELRARMQEGGVDAKEMQSQIRDLENQMAKLNAEISAAQDVRGIEQVTKILKDELEFQREKAKIEGDAGNENERQLRTQRALLQIEQQRLAEAQKNAAVAAGQQPSRESAAAGKVAKDLEEAIEKRKVEIELEERRFRQAERRRAFEREASARRRIADALVGLEAAGGKSETQGIREAALLIRNAQREVDSLQAKIQALKAESGGDAEARRDQVGIAEQALQEASELLEERKLDLIGEQIKAAKQLTEERQRQIEQTRKEIAGMSDLELLRTRITAGSIARGDLKPITQETFLGLDQETRRTLLRQGELFPGAKVAPELDLGLGPGAFQRQIPGIPTPADLQQLFQNLNIMAPAEFRGAIQNAVLQGQNITIQRADGGGGVPEAAAAVQANFNFSGLEVPMDRLVNLLGLEFESRMQALISSKIEAGERAVNRPAGYRPARVG